MKNVVVAEGIIRTSETLVKIEPHAKQVMALSFDPDSMMERGIARVIRKRTGEVDTPGYIDTSALYYVDADPTSKKGFRLGRPVSLKDFYSQEWASRYSGTRLIGLEDPDIIYDEEGVLHAYFTMAYVSKSGDNAGDHILLGHAKGNFESLTMSPPVLTATEDVSIDGETFSRGFKELCPAPKNSNGTYFHLVESNDLRNGTHFSTIAVVEATSFDDKWEFRGDAMHPALVREKYSQYITDADDYTWCSEHASPCRLLDESFISLRQPYMIGIMNGRSPKHANGHYGRFLPGLFVFDPETGSIPWVDPKPLFDDESAKTIIFASDFLYTSTDSQRATGTLIAHIDDSLVYAYNIDASALFERVPSLFLKPE